MAKAIAGILGIVYKVAIYIRLSREDIDKDGESESVSNQKSLLMRYVNENRYELVDIYIDDGVSGTTFDRPEFNRMIEDIEKGKINMVITKDLSRLGRDYIETGKYLEKYFPSHQVRYIAVTDGIDTFLDGTNNDIAPFKSLFNDMYAKDISKKIRSSLKAKMKDGKWVGGRAPFGYKIDPEDKNHLVIDEEQAPAVRRMFELASTGMTAYYIAKQLTEEKFVTPAKYLNFAWMKTSYDYGRWNPKTIKEMLISEMYIGNLVQNKRSKVNYKIKKIVWNDPSEWIIVPNTHEPLVSEKVFRQIQKFIPARAIKNTKKEIFLFDGLLTCYECKHNISIQPRRKVDNRAYTICNYYRMYIKEHLCTTHSNNYETLENQVLLLIKDLCQKYVDSYLVEENIKNKDSIDSKIEKIKNEIKNLENNIEVDISNIDKTYLDKLNGKVSNEMYERLQTRLERQISDNKGRVKMLKELLMDLQKDSKNEKNYSKVVKEFLSMEHPTRETIIKLINRIEIHNDKTLDIYFNFKQLNLMNYTSIT